MCMNQPLLCYCAHMRFSSSCVSRRRCCLSKEVVVQCCRKREPWHAQVLALCTVRSYTKSWVRVEALAKQLCVAKRALCCNYLLTESDLAVLATFSKAQHTRPFRGMSQGTSYSFRVCL